MSHNSACKAVAMHTYAYLAVSAVSQNTEKTGLNPLFRP